MPLVAVLRPVALLMMFTCVDLHAGSRQRAVAVSPPSSSDLSLTFVDHGTTPSTLIDAGTFSWRGGRRSVATTTRTFGVRIGQPSRESRGTATVRAYVENADPHATIRIDGVVLGNAPRLIQRNAPIGITVMHRLEIEVSATAPAGPVAATVGWEVTTD